MQRPSLVLSSCAAAVLLVVATPVFSQEQVVLDGSTGMLPLAKALVTAYQAKGTADRVAVGAGLGTAARLRALAEGKVDVILASHGLDPQAVRTADVRVIEVAKGAVVFGVNHSVPLSSITEKQVCDVYSGKTSDWSAFSSSAAPIVVFSRPPVEVDPRSFVPRSPVSRT